MKGWPRSIWEKQIGHTDSPIEAAFLNAFCELSVGEGYEVERMSSALVGVITIEPQRWFGNYRADFLISYRWGKMIKRLVVECDGHEFHEKTKVQAWRDKKRDREIPHKVYRFTGSEIHASAKAKAQEILDVIVDFQSWASGWQHRRAVKDAAAVREGKAARGG
jgi:very-short-patch-repair endonuclease